MRSRHETTVVELTLDMTPERFVRKKRKHLEKAVSAFLRILPTEVKTKAIKSGSAVVVLQLPIVGAAKLEQAFRNHDPELFAQHEGELVAAYNRAHPTLAVELRRRRGLRGALDLLRAS